MIQFKDYCITEVEENEEFYSLKFEVRNWTSRKAAVDNGLEILNMKKGMRDLILL